MKDGSATLQYCYQPCNIVIDAQSEQCEAKRGPIEVTRRSTRAKMVVNVIASIDSME
jgi:hypothetical protein